LIFLKSGAGAAGVVVTVAAVVSAGAGAAGTAATGGAAGGGAGGGGAGGGGAASPCATVVGCFSPSAAGACAHAVLPMRSATPPTNPKLARAVTLIGPIIFRPRSCV
jgi:hypothetical protein